jgi:D-amino-acid oxidase
MPPQVEPVVVVGAGVSGLTTAICLAEAGHDVKVWAADPPRHTTSMIAGALWGPSFQEPVAKTLAWTQQSLRDFTVLAADPGSGVRMAAALTVGDLPGPGELPPQARLIPDLRPAGPAEVPEGFGRGFRARMPLVDMPRYLDYLTERLVAAGGEIEIRALRSLDEAGRAAPVVVNCSGLGARELAGDREVRPVFGQHVVLTNPGLDTVFMELSLEPEWTSFFPHAGRVVCGSVSVPGRWDTAVDPAVSDRILQRCRGVEPRLRDAHVIDVVTGLRPDRPAVRVEAETSGAIRYVHNYGHGGNGVSLSWGCAREAAHLAAAGR